MPTIPLTLIEAGRYWTPAELTAIPTVALTEDDDDPCEIVQRHLEALGYRVLAVASIGLHATAEIASTMTNTTNIGHTETTRVTAETVSDEQICDLREKGPRTADVLYECDLALFASRGEYGAGVERAALARARCAEMINARAARHAP